MIRTLAYTFQVLIVIVLSHRVFIVLRDPEYLRLTYNGISSADIATALQVEYAGLRQLIHETQSFPAISHNLTVGSFGIEDVANAVRYSSLDGAAVLADSLEAFQRDARTTGRHFRMFQLKVDGLADR